jgi:purine nucleoside permease
MLLRAASNFDMPPDGIPAAEQLVREGPQAFAGYVPALEGIHLVGSQVVDELIGHWSRYEKEMPQPESAPR